MLSALIGGQVDLAFDGLGSSSNHIRSGTIKPLAVAASGAFAVAAGRADRRRGRRAELRGVHLVRDLGAGRHAREAVDRMTAEITKALNTPKIKEIWTSNGSAIPGMTGADFGQFVDSEVARWAKVVRDSGVQLD